ncbi:site-2 protease family protein [bacterium]|nr:site-2 protease family protein [bacterium]
MQIWDFWDCIILAFVFLAAIILHEVAHGYVAYLFGDDTAKKAGRLTLNPLPHMDVVGTIFLIIVLTTGYGIGWAKPVPINPRKFRNLRKGLFWVALAGPATNILLVILSLMLTALNERGWIAFPGIETMIQAMFFLNLLLATFNLVPVPPLDGSRVVSSFLSFKAMRAYNSIEPYGIGIIILMLIIPFPPLGGPPLRIALQALYQVQAVWFNEFINWVAV